MRKVVVIGGGIAGLSAASFLSYSGFKIKLLEASPKLGGRAYSYTDKESGIPIDNGQHIFMGCYFETLKFFKLIGAEHNLSVQSHLSLNFVKENFEICPLTTSGSFYPFNLLRAVLNYSAFLPYEKLLFIKFFTKIYLYSNNDLKKLTVFEWLIKEKQTVNLIKSFWEILAVAALNIDIKRASAKVFAKVLKEIFFRGNNASVLILPALGLSETYCEHSVKFITSKGGDFFLPEQVIRLNIQNNIIREIITNKRSISGFDYVISAIPLYAFKKIMNENNFLTDLQMDYSSILTVHLFLKQNRFDRTFYGLIDSPVQWVFNNQSHLTIVISNADKFIKKPGAEIIEIVLNEMKKYFHMGKNEISAYKIIKEKRAAFIPSNNVVDKRPSARTPFKNLFLAGDWTDTGLPSTIESAVKSGRVAADAIINL
ncbi:MAG: hydroxysqualene dehydroxylase HpnE [Ignavibacteriaceae bacterium]|nr:hydroxysqualene dehydroxylase HpnE [Ignavibacteriaceae bacterium]